MGMRSLTVVLLLIWSCATISAQDIIFSEAQKLPGKTQYFRILGKNNQGIILRKYGKSVNIIEAYSGNLKLNWRRDLSLAQSNPEIIKMVLYPSKTHVFYLSVVKGENVVFVDRLDAKFMGNGQSLAIDTLGREIEGDPSRVKLVHSQDKSKQVIYTPYYKGAELQGVRLVGLSDALQVLYKHNVELANLDGSLSIRRILPADSGDVYLLIENKDREKRKSNVEDEYYVLRFDPVTKTVSRLDFEIDDRLFGNMMLEMDNVNNRLVAIGFYSGDGKKIGKGYFYHAYDLSTKQLVTKVSNDFGADLLFKITGKDSIQNDGGLYSFNINEVILRYDGGAIIIAESKFDNTENRQVPSFVATAGPSFRTVNVTYFNDVMVISLLPDGTHDWETLLRKKQVSEDDDGWLSSYCMVTTYDKLRFVYNEEIYPNTNINEYSVDSKGETKREFILNAGDENVTLVPKSGKQISAREVVIPSFRRSYIRLVKITY